MGGGPATVDLGKLLAKRLHWIGTTLRARPAEQKLAISQRFAAEVLPLFDDGALRPVIDRRFPFDAIAEAHRMMESNANIGKLLIDVR
jgi:NADPH:quinone reductase-like Zn-dependent oxidoreductase